MATAIEFAKLLAPCVGLFESTVERHGCHLRDAGLLPDEDEPLTAAHAATYLSAVIGARAPTEAVESALLFAKLPLSWAENWSGDPESGAISGKYFTDQGSPTDPAAGGPAFSRMRSSYTSALELFIEEAARIVPLSDLKTIPGGTFPDVVGQLRDLRAPLAMVRLSELDAEGVRQNIALHYGPLGAPREAYLRADGRLRLWAYFPPLLIPAIGSLLAGDEDGWRGIAASAAAFDPAGLGSIIGGRLMAGTDLISQLLDALGLSNPSADALTPAPAPGTPQLGGAAAPQGPGILGGPLPKDGLFKTALLGLAGGLAAPRHGGGVLGSIGAGLQGGMQAVDQHRQQQAQDQQQKLRDYLLNRQITQQDTADAQKQKQADMIAKIPPPNGMDPATWANLPDDTKLSLYTQSVTPEKPKHSAAYTEFQDAQAGGYQGTFNDYQNMDANRRRPVTVNNSPGPETWGEPYKDPTTGGIVQKSNRGQLRTLQGETPEPHKTADQQDWDTVLYGDPSSREYHAAYARISQPKMQPSADGTKLIPVPPLLPKDLRPPVYSNQGPGGNATPPNPANPAPPDATGGAGVPTVDLGKKAPTQEQSNAAGFATRTETANSQLEALMKAGYAPSVTHLAAMGADGVTGMLANRFVLSAQDQQFDQARRNFINATLRRESGAAISPSEFDNANKQYFPMPGDSPEVLAQKAINRRQVIDSLKAGSGPAAVPTDGGGGNVPVAGGSDSYGGGAQAAPTAGADPLGIR